MKTEVEMVRSLWGSEIRQKSKTGYFCASDLVNAGNVWRVRNGLKIFNYSAWLKNKSTSEFIEELELQFGRVIIKGNAKNSPSWIHPFLFIDLALALSPSLKVETYSWLYDHLLKYRNDSGNSFKKMSGALYLKSGNKTEFPALIKKIANGIKFDCGVKDWQEATEKQLRLRDRIHENIALLVDVLPIEDAVRIGKKKAIETEAEAYREIEKRPTILVAGGGEK